MREGHLARPTAAGQARSPTTRSTASRRRRSSRASPTSPRCSGWGRPCPPRTRGGPGPRGGVVAGRPREADGLAGGGDVRRRRGASVRVRGHAARRDQGPGSRTGRPCVGGRAKAEALLEVVKQLRDRATRDRRLHLILTPERIAPTSPATNSAWTDAPDTDQCGV